MIRKKPNIILVLFDSMRARNVSGYGYPRQTTPNLDRLASQGVRYTNAFVQAPFTVASTASILTSVYPSVHQLERYRQRLTDRLVTLPEVLQTAGYTTSGFVANPHINQESGLTRGFHHFTDGRPWYKQMPGVKHFAAWAESGKALNRCVKEWISNAGQEPFFFFVFYNDSHVPFSDLPRILLPLANEKLHTPDFETISYTDDELTRIIDLYDRALTRADRRLAELVQLIQGSPYADNTIFLISADHGEGLDRRYDRAGHGRLYENGIHVPLVAWAPWMQGRGSVRDEMVTALDLAPTICEWAGAEIPDHWQGQSFAPAVEDRPVIQRRDYVISEYHDSRCIRTRDWKLLQRDAGIGDFNLSESGVVELYNLKNDPDENHNLAGQHPEKVAELSQLLRQWMASLGEHQYSPSTFEADDLVLDRLRGLGYIE